MVRGEEDKTSQAILSTLTRIDLYHHSLKMAADKLIAQIGSAEGADASVELRERSLELGRECSDVLGSLRGLVNEDERGPVDSALDTVDLALTRASGASNETLHLLNIWRVVEATERLVSVLGDRHGYESISGESVPVVNDEREVKGTRLVRLFAEYEDAMAREPSPVAEGGPPFEHGILQWRGNQLYYVQRVEDGARWVELDPDSEPRVIGEERGGVEIAEARSVEGYPLNLMLDVNLDANVVDEYIRSQTGHEYYVSGYQVAAESQGGGSGLSRRRR